VFNEVYLSASGKWFAYCGRCKTRCFLNTWEKGWGWTLAQAESPPGQGGWGAQVDIPPPRRMELEKRAAARPRRSKTPAVAATAARRRD